MPRVLPILLFLLVCVALPTRLAAQQRLMADLPLRLYVGTLDGPEAELAHAVRARLVDNLIERGIVLVESEENADAILTGSYVRQTAAKVSVGRRRSLCIRGDLRLSTPQGLVLWSGDLASDRYAISQTTNFVDKAGKQIDHALELTARRKHSEPLSWKPR